MKKIIFFILVLLSFNSLRAQDVRVKIEEEKSSVVDRFELHSTIESNHLWRGLVISDMPTVSSILSFYFDDQKQWRVGLWGGSAISRDNNGTHYKEINYFIEYSSEHFTIGLWDLFNTKGLDNPEIFNYNDDETTHLIDLRTNYFINDEFPLRLQANILLYGTGDQIGMVDEVVNNDQQYSTYIEAAYPIYVNNNINVNAHLGAGFALDGDTHLYGDGEEKFDIVNFGFTANRNLNIGKYTLPLHATFMWNPSIEIARMQIAVDLF